LRPGGEQSAAGARRQRQGVRHDVEDPLGGGPGGSDRRRSGAAGTLHLQLDRALGTAKTPKPIIDKIEAAVAAALADPDVRKRYEELGQELPAPGKHTAEALRAFHKAEVEKWGPIIRAANIQPN
jgi:Uncharacterized protein conserved in bacteria